MMMLQLEWNAFKYLLIKLSIRSDSGQRIIEESWELIFWENHKATYRFTLEDNKHDLIHLSKQQRDSEEKVKTGNAESLRKIYQIVLKAAEKTNMPHRYSPEFIFAQEFAKHYDEFAIYFPEFGRLRELSKAATLVNIMAAQRIANQEEIQQINKYLNYKNCDGLQSKQPWQVKEYEYWQTVRQKLAERIREHITKQFADLRSECSREKLEQKRQESLNDIRQQMGTLKFTRSSPEIQDICNKYYNEIKSDVIAKHGYSGWNSVSNNVYREVIEPKIPEFIAQLESQKK